MGVGVGGVPTRPVYAGEMQSRSLGVTAAAFNERRQSVVDEVGELVVTEPLPSMPLYFWNDPGCPNRSRWIFSLTTQERRSTTSRIRGRDRSPRT